MFKRIKVKFHDKSGKTRIAQLVSVGRNFKVLLQSKVGTLYYLCIYSSHGNLTAQHNAIFYKIAIGSCLLNKVKSCASLNFIARFSLIFLKFDFSQARPRSESASYT